MKITESSAERYMLAWCRKNSHDGIIGMRVRYDNTHILINLEKTKAKLGSDWEREPIIYASGATWVECYRDGLAKCLFAPMPENNE